MDFLSSASELIPGYATPEGTARFASRFPSARAAEFFRPAQSLTVSSIGMGTYLGERNEATDARYTDAALQAIRGGINFLDTSLNYRHQRSELSIGKALRAAFANGFRRDELVICTKAGYLTPQAIPAELDPAEVYGGMHCMAPEFLGDQLQRSRRNLGLSTIDVFYLHNPETQLNPGVDEFYRRVGRAFAFLEEAVRQGFIRNYGVATWDGFRRRPGGPEGLSLDRLAALAREAGGEEHHFRFVQLPVNLAMPEAFLHRHDGRNVLTRAAEAGMTVAASASLLQSRLAAGLPDEVTEMFPGLKVDAQRALQFARSTPGVTVALVGMSRAEHVAENLQLALVPPASPERYARFFADH